MDQLANYAFLPFENINDENVASQNISLFGSLFRIWFVDIKLM